MNILFDINHPAHVHLFKNLIKHLIPNHKIVVTARQKDVTTILLEHHNIDYMALSEISNNSTGLIAELLIKDYKTLLLHLKHKFDIGIGTSYSIPHVSFISRMKSYFFNEDDDRLSKFNDLFVQPFATKIINPKCLYISSLKAKRVLYNSYHELAYLHPNNFTPNIALLKKYDLVDKKYVILRLNSLQAHHDIGAKGISNEMYLKIKALLKDYIIIESRENSKTHQIEPWDMHHVLAFAKMIICDSQTMAAEAMVLGVPSIRINTFVGRISYLEELENKYNLGYGILPLAENESNILDTINHLANDTNIESLWQEKKEKMLSEKCDLNQWMIEYFEKEINKTIVK